MGEHWCGSVSESACTCTCGAMNQNQTAALKKDTASASADDSNDELYYNNDNYNYSDDEKTALNKEAEEEEKPRRFSDAEDNIALMLALAESESERIESDSYRHPHNNFNNSHEIHLSDISVSDASGYSSTMNSPTHSVTSSARGTSPHVLTGYPYLYHDATDTNDTTDTAHGLCKYKYASPTASASTMDDAESKLLSQSQSCSPESESLATHMMASLAHRNNKPHRHTSHDGNMNVNARTGRVISFVRERWQQIAGSQQDCPMSPL